MFFIQRMVAIWNTLHEWKVKADFGSLWTYLNCSVVVGKQSAGKWDQWVLDDGAAGPVSMLCDVIISANAIGKAPEIPRHCIEARNLILPGNNGMENHFLEQ